MSIKYGLYDYIKGNEERLFELFRETYGDDTPYRNRWKWEIEQNPYKDEIKIFTAESEGKVIGTTTRLPVTIKFKEQIINSAFSVNSMVHPEFRRRGIIQKLYEMSADSYDILYSKGTMPGMYKLLLKMGYKPIYPNTNLVCVLSPIKWVLWRLGIFKPNIRKPDIKSSLFQDFQKVKKINKEFDHFYERISKCYIGMVIKDSKFIRWRFDIIPHKHYDVFYRKVGEKIISYLVLSFSGSVGKIVDILWDKKAKDEPDRSIKFSKHYFKQNGLIKLSCWGTYEKLRYALKKQRFYDREEVHTFSIYSKKINIENLTDGKKFHFVESDSDAEYL